MKILIKRFLAFVGLFKYVVRVFDWFIFTKNYWTTVRKISAIPKNVSVLYFFPFYHTGGAEWVHLKIVEAIGEPTVVFFTHQSSNNHYKALFEKQAICFELKPFISKERHRKKIKSVILKKIKSIKSLSTFGCHTPFYYELLPQMGEKVNRFDLLHAFTHKHEVGAEKYSLPYVSFLKNRVTISEKGKLDLLQQYEENMVDPLFGERIRVIPNCSTFSSDHLITKPKDTFNIVYVGRNSPEKRISLIGEIASGLKRYTQKFNVILIGEDLENGVNPENKADCIFKGRIWDLNELKREYENAHAVIITSHREGFPMTIMEGMILGAIPVSTNVGGISEHVITGKTGFLVDSNSTHLVDDFLRHFLFLKENEKETETIRKNVSNYAKATFSVDSFNRNYQNLFGG